MRTFKAELEACKFGFIGNLKEVTLDKPFYADGCDGVDEGSPFVWYYNMPKGSGFLICWPEGTRLRVNTVGNVTVCHTWWLEPISEQIRKVA